MSTDAEFADALLDEAAAQAARDPSVRRSDWQTGIVTAVNVVPGTVDVGTIRARRLESYLSPKVGDQIIISQSGMRNWVALGRTSSWTDAVGVARYAYKAASTDRTSTTTLTADPDLTLDLDDNAVYAVEFHLFTGSGAGLMRTSWTAPSGATGLKGAHGPGSTQTDNGADNISGRFGSHNFATTIWYGYRSGSYTNLIYALETGTVMTTSAGTLALAWSQNVSNTTPTRMGLGSWMRATRIA